MKNLKGIKGTIIIFVCACLCVGYYFHLSRKDQPQEEIITTLEQTMNMDLNKNYPGTPREVVKFYNRIISCLYNEEVSEEEVEILVQQARTLMDQELLDYNPESVHLGNMEWEISQIRQEGKKVVRTNIATGSDIEFRKIQGKECAYVEVSYYLQGNTGAEKVEQTYILRKMPEGNWKILGYYKG